MIYKHLLQFVWVFDDFFHKYSQQMPSHVSFPVSSPLWCFVVGSMFTQRSQSMQGPIPLMIFHAKNTNLMGIIVCCITISNHQIAPKFCTCHDSCAVMACAKLWSNQCTEFSESIAYLGICDGWYTVGETGLLMAHVIVVDSCHWYWPQEIGYQHHGSATLMIDELLDQISSHGFSRCNFPHHSRITIKCSKSHHSNMIMHCVKFHHNWIRRKFKEFDL